MFCYIHIPFCTSKCSYCRFASFSNFDEVKIQFYVDFFCKDIIKKPKQDKPLQSIYFGGGTPSLLSIKQLEQIFSALRYVFSFSKDIEITLETTPQNISLKNLKAWKKLGINRISTGIQSLNEKALQEIGRISPQQIFQTLDILENSPIKNISLDFIIGLPFTKVGELKNNIESILRTYTFPKHISVYMLEEYSYPKYWEVESFGKESYNEEYRGIKNFLESKGIFRYELSNFSKNGYECKHNQAYWNHSEVIAFGLGSYGFESGIRYSHAENFIDYYAGKGYKEDILDSEAIRIEKIMFGFRTNGFDESLLEKNKRNIVQNFLNDEYLLKDGNTLSLGEKGTTLMDSILSDII